MDFFTSLFKQASLLPEAGAREVTSLDALRKSKKLSALQFLVVEPTNTGLWYVDNSDTTSPDNTATVIVTVNGVRIKRFYQGPINLSWIGLVPNDRAQALNNSLKLDEFIKSTNDVHLLLPGGTYYFDAVPGSGAFDSNVELAAISFRDKNVLFEGSIGSSIITLPGAVGIQWYRTIGDCNVRLKNIRLQAEYASWYNTYRQLEDGTFDQDYGTYKINGINAWGLGSLEDCSVYGYPGHGMCIFGSSQIRLNSASFPLSGTIGRDRHYDNFVPDGEGTINLLQPNVTMVLDGISYGAGGIQGSGVPIRTTDTESLAAGTKVKGYGYARGNPLNADHITTRGINSFAANRGCGIFTTGDEANQGIFFGIDVRNNGAWGICDSSLLGNIWLAPHGTQNGERFNSLYTNPQSLVMGSFTNRDYNTTTSTFIGYYTEQGNQGPNKFGLSTFIGGGFDGAGTIGGFGLKNAGQMYNLHSSGYRTPTRIEYNDTLDFFREGVAARFGMNEKGLPTWNDKVLPGFE
jgi:hypothetical protein